MQGLGFRFNALALSVWARWPSQEFSKPGERAGLPICALIQTVSPLVTMHKFWTRKKGPAANVDFMVFAYPCVGPPTLKPQGDYQEFEFSSFEC